MVFMRTAFPSPHVCSIYSSQFCLKQNQEYGSGILCNYLKKLLPFPDSVDDNALIVPLQFPFQNKEPEAPVGSVRIQMCPLSTGPQQHEKIQNGVHTFAPFRAPAMWAVLVSLTYPHNYGRQGCSRRQRKAIAVQTSLLIVGSPPLRGQSHWQEEL